MKLFFLCYFLHKNNVSEIFRYQMIYYFKLLLILVQIKCVRASLLRRLGSFRNQTWEF